MSYVGDVGAQRDGLAQVLQRVQQIRSSVASLGGAPRTAQRSFEQTLVAAEAHRTASPAAAAEERNTGTSAQWGQVVSPLASALLRGAAAPAGTGSPPTHAGGVTAPVGHVVAPAGGAAALGAGGVPVDLRVHGNGKIPPGALVEIGHGSHRLWSPAATAFTTLHAAAARDGVHFGITDSYRSYAAQVDLVARKGLYSQGGLAARPGTSDHGWGRSVDLDLGPEAQSWMRSNAGKYGFEEDVPREPWHWTYTPPA